jgi:hypothetical protein
VLQQSRCISRRTAILLTFKIEANGRRQAGGGMVMFFGLFDCVLCVVCCVCGARGLVLGVHWWSDLDLNETYIHWP